MDNYSYHRPVLLSESVDGLCIADGGVYVDVTFGGGGHSCEIMSRLSVSGHLLAFDQDADAAVNVIDDERFTFIQANFRYLKNFLRYYDFFPVNGILADLGVSSYQFDNAERGFSIRHQGPLDLRMNASLKRSAADLVNKCSLEELARIFREYGEVSNAFALAKKVVKLREQELFSDTLSFIDKLKSLAPRGKENRYFAQVFQALRIEINQEMQALKIFLQQSLSCLAPGGYLSIISYHSLEDRMVKNFFKSGNVDGKIEKDLFGNVNTPFELITRKPIVPTEEEVQRNPRARSAKLRIVRKK